MFRAAWIALLAVEGIFLLFGIGDVILGTDADPAIVESIADQSWINIERSYPLLANVINLYVRSQGFTITMLSIISILITVNAFRRGEKWAWFALWVWPVWMASIFFQFNIADRHPDFAAPPPMLSAPVFFGITLLALVLSYRKFFSKV